MKAEYLIRKGRQHYSLLMGALIVLCLVNTVYEIIYGASYGILIAQLSALVILSGLAALVSFGYKYRSLLFGHLLFTGVFAFYEAGTRTPDLRKTDMGFVPLATLFLGLAFIFGAIYLSYSTEIKAFIDKKQFDRAQEKAKEFE